MDQQFGGASKSGHALAVRQQPAKELTNASIVVETLCLEVTDNCCIVYTDTSSAFAF
jgi:hypothetical protein